MKLIDLLVKHLAVWPKDVGNVCQGFSRNLYVGYPEYPGRHIMLLPELAEERVHDRQCSHEQWEAARKKWIRNRGTKKSPVADPEQRIDIRLRNGYIVPGVLPKHCWWNHHKLGEARYTSDIMAWRFHQPMV